MLRLTISELTRAAMSSVWIAITCDLDMARRLTMRKAANWLVLRAPIWSVVRPAICEVLKDKTCATSRLTTCSGVSADVFRVPNATTWVALKACN